MYQSIKLTYYDMPNFIIIIITNAKIRITFYFHFVLWKINNDNINNIKQLRKSG